jgi:flagellar basal-body rod modification protein FlgD
MSSIDSNSQAHLNTILDKIGVKSEESKKPASKDNLGQEDFLKLMTTQLQNQDPFAPMENAEFIGQMAQFSTVTGIAEMGEALKSISSQLNEFRIATASNMLGSSVMIPGNYARIDSEQTIHGMIDLPKASARTEVRFTDASGNILHSKELGAQASGLVGFSWEDIPADIADNNEAIRIEAFADFGNGIESLTPSVFAEVLAASAGDETTGVVLNVRDYGEVLASDVQKFRR